MSKSFAVITYALKQVKKTGRNWEISRPFELKEPDSNYLGVNETCYNSDVIVGEEERLKDEDRNNRLDVPSSRPFFKKYSADACQWVFRSIPLKRSNSSVSFRKIRKSEMMQKLQAKVRRRSTRLWLRTP